MLVDAMCPQTPGKERFESLVRLANPADERAAAFSQCLEAHRRVRLQSFVQAIHIDLYELALVQPLNRGTAGFFIEDAQLAEHVPRVGPLAHRVSIDRLSRSGV